MFIFFPPFLVSSCWLSYTNNLIWIFAAFMAFVEVVSLKLVSPSHWPLMEIVFLVPMLITKGKSYFCFRPPGSKLTIFSTSFTPTYVFSITRLSSNHSADIWHSLFVSAQHFDSRPSHKRDDHASAAYGGRHSYQADTVRFKICS